jgi:hypothetical protein
MVEVRVRDQYCFYSRLFLCVKGSRDGSGIYEQIILCIITIGLVGFVLDRLMSVIEARFKSI